MTETAEQILARQRQQAKARRARYHASHPDAAAKQRDRYRKAEGVLRDKHHDEYLAVAAAERAGGTETRRSYAKAIAELRRRYPDEWTDILAVTS